MAYEPIIIPVPWRREIATIPVRKLRIGYYLDDGIVRVQPPQEAAARKAVQALQADGHDGEGIPSPCGPFQKAADKTVFRWDISDHGYAYSLWFKAVLSDGGRRCKLQCEQEGEPLIEGMLVGKDEHKFSVEEGEQVGLHLFWSMVLKSSLMILKVHGQIKDYQRSHLTKWRESQVDAFIMPV